MTPETAGLTFAEIALRGGPSFAAVGVWIFGAFMVFQNWRRERKADAAQAQAAEDRKAAQAQAAEDRKAAQADAAEDRKAIAAQMAHQAEQAAEDRKAIAAQMAHQAEQAAEDRKAIAAQMAHQAEQATKDRKAIMSLAQATLHAAQATSEDRQRVLETLRDQGAALQVLIATLTNSDSPRGPWGGSSKPGSDE